MRLSDSELDLVREREQAYDEVDVTDAIEDAPDRVVTFVPKTQHRRDLVGPEFPLVVHRSYLDDCLRGAAEHALARAVLELLECLDLQVVELGAVYELQPPHLTSSR